MRVVPSYDQGLDMYIIEVVNGLKSVTFGFADAYTAARMTVELVDVLEADFDE